MPESAVADLQEFIRQLEAILNRLTRERDEARVEISRLQALLSEELLHGPLNVQGLQAAKILEVGIMLSKLGRPDHEDITDGVRWLVAERDRLRTLLREVAKSGVYFASSNGMDPVSDVNLQVSPQTWAALKAVLEE